MCVCVCVCVYKFISILLASNLSMKCVPKYTDSFHNLSYFSIIEVANGADINTKCYQKSFLPPKLESSRLS